MDVPRLKLSAVIISWNQLAFLKTLVDQLLNQDYPSDCYEIIVVDDGSTDGSREWLKQSNDHRVIPVLGDSDSGRAASRNRGIRIAQGDIVVMVDGDHTIDRNFLSVHARRHAAERCIIVGKSDFAEQPEYTAINHYLNNGGAAKLPENSRLPGRYFLTRNCSVPHDLLLQIGLFDERFSTWGGEDLDLGIRLQATGVPIYGEPQALAIHHHFRDLCSLMNNIYRYGHDGIPLLLEKHPQLFAELNLDRVFTLQGYGSRHDRITQWIMRSLMTSPIYRLCLWIGVCLRRHKLPRLLFDYLHLRQYSRGFMDYLNERGV